MITWSRKLYSPLPLLIAVVALAAIVVVGARCVVFSKYDKQPLGTDIRRATDKDQQRAVEIVRASGIVERINDNQPWEASHAIEGWRHDATVLAQWEEPVESNGPWQWVECNVWHQRAKIPWTNLRFLNVSVNVATEEIIRIRPGYPFPPHYPGEPEHVELHPKRGMINPFATMTVWEKDTGNTIYWGPLMFRPIWPGPCPRGFGYRD